MIGHAVGADQVDPGERASTHAVVAVDADVRRKLDG